ncbi:MerR family transcriptional regulator [Acinetobacter sp. 272263]|uniref:MerR family transcriptional regulator n=1 Tax=Acinetobacter sp. 272263 TaxID=1310639 RepID=UPI00044BABF1|nr:MerR family transcriptional regulator [Acinetobacter sp. 272263]EXB83513.1 merR regulatory family protein [Acinetobacter sp. 272263]
MLYSIGELARKSKISVDSIRFYEKKNLLSLPLRGNNNYRYYDDTALEQLIFIRYCRELGMSLKEIGQLTELLKKPQQQCNTVDQLLEDHLGHIEQKLQRLENFRTKLQQLRQTCRADLTIQDCKIVSGLKHPEP